MDTIQAVVRGAEKLESPVIISTTPAAIKYAGIEYLSGIIKTVTENTYIPIAMHADHCKEFELLEMCVKNGYTSLMIDGSHLGYQKNIDLTKKVVKLREKYNVYVEAEIGRIQGIEDGLRVSAQEAAMTMQIDAYNFSKRQVLTPWH